MCCSAVEEHWIVVPGDCAEIEPDAWGTGTAECHCGGFGECICIDDGQVQELDWPEENWNDWAGVAGGFAETEPDEWGAGDAECRCGDSEDAYALTTSKSRSSTARRSRRRQRALRWQLHRLPWYVKVRSLVRAVSAAQEHHQARAGVRGPLQGHGLRL